MVHLLNALPLFYFAGLIIYDLWKERDISDIRQLVRVLACLVGIVLSFSGFFNDQECRLKFLVVDVGAVDLALLASTFLVDVRRNGLAILLSFLSMYVLLVALLPLFSNLFEDFNQGRLAMSCLMITAFCLFSLYWLMVSRLSNLKNLFRDDSVLDFVEIASVLCHMAMFLVLLVWLLCAVHMKKCGNLATAMLLVPFLAQAFLLFRQSYSGWSGLVPKRKETRIREMVKERCHAKYPDKVTDDVRMNALYERIRKYMEEKEPFLDSSFSMGVMSRDLYSNKLYLSRTINTLSGRNFRQFVNYYRIEHAKALFHSDPGMRVADVAEKSGFHTVVSFNIAFKTNTGQTPSAWLQDQVLPFS
jgi:Response regulator containing CheY-like receiver domain and AraC-type DNA-binding domain